MTFFHVLLSITVWLLLQVRGTNSRNTTSKSSTCTPSTFIKFHSHYLAVPCPTSRNANLSSLGEGGMQAKWILPPGVRSQDVAFMEQLGTVILKKVNKKSNGFASCEMKSGKNKLLFKHYFMTFNMPIYRIITSFVFHTTFKCNMNNGFVQAKIELMKDVACPARLGDDCKRGVKGSCIGRRRLEIKVFGSQTKMKIQITIGVILQRTVVTLYGISLYKGDHYAGFTHKQQLKGKCGLACAGIQAMVKAISDTQYFVHQLNLANYKYSGTSQITYDKKHTKAVVQVLCDQGFVYSQSKNLCLPCPPGRYSSEGKACEKCESGSYQEYFGAFACTECPSGSKLKYKGATSPKECQSTGKSKKQKYEVCEYQQMFSKETRQARDESSLDDINENFYDDESYAVSQPSIPSDSFEERFLLGLNMNSHQKRHSNNDVTELVHEKAALTSAPQAGGGETNSDYSENIKVLKRGYRDFQDKLLHVTKSSGQLKNFYKQLEIIENVLESTGEGLPVNRDSPLPSQLGLGKGVLLKRDLDGLSLSQLEREIREEPNKVTANPVKLDLTQSSKYFSPTSNVQVLRQATIDLRKKLEFFLRKGQNMQLYNLMQRMKIETTYIMILRKLLHATSMLYSLDEPRIQEVKTEVIKKVNIELTAVGIGLETLEHDIGAMSRSKMMGKTGTGGKLVGKKKGKIVTSDDKVAISEHTDPNHVLDEVKTKILRERILRYHQVIKELNLVNAKLKILRNHLHQMPELPSRNVLLDRVGKLDEMLTYPENVITALDDIKDKRQYYDLLKTERVINYVNLRLDRIDIIRKQEVEKLYVVTGMEREATANGKVAGPLGPQAITVTQTLLTLPPLTIPYTPPPPVPLTAPPMAPLTPPPPTAPPTRPPTAPPITLAKAPPIIVQPTVPSTAPPTVPPSSIVITIPGLQSVETVTADIDDDDDDENDDDVTELIERQKSTIPPHEHDEDISALKMTKPTMPRNATVTSPPTTPPTTVQTANVTTVVQATSKSMWQEELQLQNQKTAGSVGNVQPSGGDEDVPMNRGLWWFLLILLCGTTIIVVVGVTISLNCPEFLPEPLWWMNARYNGPSNCDSKTSLDSLVVGNNSANDREREFSTHNKLNIAPSFTNERQRGLLMTGNPPMDPRRPNGQGFSMNPMDPRQSNLVTSGNLSEPRRPNGHVSTGTLGFNIGPQASASRVPSVHENRNYSSNQPSSIMLNRTGSSTITQFTAALPTANGPIM